MIHSEFSAGLERVRRSAFVVYTVTAVIMMISIFGVIYNCFPEIQKLSFFFHDPTKALEDDVWYGAIIGLLMGALFFVPSTLLPLLFVAIADRTMGIACLVCRSSLTLWKRGKSVLKSGRCPKCSATIIESLLP